MQPSFDPSRIRQLITGLLLAVVAVCAALLLLEGAVRLLLPPPYAPGSGPLFACHPRLGWTGRPDLSMITDDTYLAEELRFNRLGMHDTDHTLDKPPGTFRILMLGDSFVQAVQVIEAETAHQVLEELLNHQGGFDGRPVEVISGGVVNWGTNQELLFYREYGRAFQPDLVVLMVYLGNDLLDNLPGNVLTIGGKNCYAPYFALCDGSLIPEPLTYAPGVSTLREVCSPVQRFAIDALGFLYQHSRLYQQIEPAIISQQPRQIFGQTYPSPFSALYVDTDEAVLEQAWQITTGAIAQLRQETAADGVPLVVGIISPEIVVRLATLSPAEQAVFLQDNPKFAAADLEQPNQRLGQFLNGQNIPFVDLAPPMAAHLAANPDAPLYFVGEGHWTVEGNRLAARVLHEWLSQLQEIR